MADALVAGVQYGLSSRNSQDNNNLVFVKLTDSAYRAIEEFIKNGDRTKKPTIQFLNNEGHLSIPATQAGSGSGPHSHVFNFSLAPTAQAEEGTFDCLRSQGGGGRTLHAVGSLSHQMWIQANDDVYETTRHRMAAAEEQSKKNCTRVIKPNTSEIGRKVKLKNWGNGPTHTPPVPSHPTPPVIGQPHHAATRVPTNPTSLHTRTMTNNHAQKPGNPEIMRRSIKERLIHLLAVRPYKKPELVDRIHREGIKERDKRNVTQALSQVSTMRENTYHLMRSMWNEVQEDWPFYTEQDRQMLKRRKPQNLTPPGSSDTGSSGSGQSPSSTHPGSPPSAAIPKRSGYTDPDTASYKRLNGYVDLDAVPSTKRPGYFETADGLQSKRQRISHFRKPPVSLDPGTDKPYNLDRPEKPYSVERPEKPYSLERQERPDRINSRSSPNIKRSESPATVTSSQPIGDTYAPSSPQHPVRPSSDLGKIQENTVSASEMPEYIMEYTPIKDTSQRRKYKDVFNQDYDEYKKLHAVVEQVSQKFSSLESELQRTNPGTSEYKRIKKQVLKEYQENLQDTKYHEAKKRFHYLHEKLSHIKKLVADYDASIDY